jgi:hypothetical protein
VIIHSIGGVKMRELCGSAAEYLGCRILPDELESGGQEFRFEGGLVNVFATDTKESGQKHIYRPLA